MHAFAARGVFCAYDYWLSDCGAAYEAGADGVIVVWACYAGFCEVGIRGSHVRDSAFRSHF